MKSEVMNVLMTTERWQEGTTGRCWGSRSKWMGINTTGIWLIIASAPERPAKVGGGGEGEGRGREGGGEREGERRRGRDGGGEREGRRRREGKEGESIKYLATMF